MLIISQDGYMMLKKDHTGTWYSGRLPKLRKVLYQESFTKEKQISIGTIFLPLNRVGEFQLRTDDQRITRVEQKCTSFKINFIEMFWFSV